MPIELSWPEELMRGIHDYSTAEQWQFEFVSDHGGGSWLSAPLSKNFPAEQVLVHLMLGIFEKFTHCPRCHDWVLTVSEMNPIHNICTACVSDIKAGHPLKNHGEDHLPRESAEWFYQTLLGPNYEELLDNVPLVALESESKQQDAAIFEAAPKRRVKKAKGSKKQSQTMNAEQAAAVAATFLEMAPLFANFS